jgi:solute carrier family 25, member 44
MAEASAASAAGNGKPATPPQLADISWEELDKPKFYALGMTSFLGLRALLYPTFLIKTRMQTSTGLYTGTLDAAQKIVRTEGVKGIYRGFWVSSLSIVPRQVSQWCICDLRF